MVKNDFTEYSLKMHETSYSTINNVESFKYDIYTLTSQIGVAYNMSNVSLYVVDLARTSPFNGIPVAESVVGFYRCGH